MNPGFYSAISRVTVSPALTRLLEKEAVAVALWALIQIDEGELICRKSNGAGTKLLLKETGAKEHPQNF